MQLPQEDGAETLPGISAVLATSAGPAPLDGAVLDLAAVLAGLAESRFEIVVLEDTANPAVAEAVSELRVRCPSLPVRLHAGQYVGHAAALAQAIDAAAYDLILVWSASGEFDVREANHLLEAIERGADLAIGYRPHRADGLGRRLAGWSWNALAGVLFGNIARDVDCPFKLFRASVWHAVRVRASGPTFNIELLIRARRLGFRVAELPVSHHRPPAGQYPRAASLTWVGRALVELVELHGSLARETAHPATATVPAGRQPA